MIPGHWEIVLLAIVVIALFGNSMLPKIARQAGRAAREVRAVKRDVLSLEDDQKPEAKSPTSAP